MGLLALALPMIKPIVLGVNALFRSKEKSGKDKFAAVLMSIRAVLMQMSNAKVLGEHADNIQPTDDAVAGAIETIFQEMKTTGEVDGPKEGAKPTPMLWMVEAISAPVRLK